MLSQPKDVCTSCLECVDSTVGNSDATQGPASSINDARAHDSRVTGHDDRPESLHIFAPSDDAGRLTTSVQYS